MSKADQQNIKVLFVDDEANLLEGIKRGLRKLFSIDTATSGKEGLEKLAESDPYAVVVSDLRMPIMDGIAFLSKVKERYPDTVRVMLTGFADIENAMAAVNEGNIFRFITKPTSAQMLVKVLEASFDQYALITAQKELLEQTLHGSIKVLTDILSMTNPEAFSRTIRIKYFVKQLASRLALHDLWRYEVAAMLSQIGCVTVPSETLERYFAGEKLSDVEQEMIDSYPDIGSKLISPIPRLGAISEIIACQANIPDSITEEAKTGADILKVAIDFDMLLSRGLNADKAIHDMKQKSDMYNADILNLVANLDIPGLETTSRMVKAIDLRNGMVIAEDIRSKNGLLVVAKGQIADDALRQRLMNFARQGTIAETIRVEISQRQFEETL